MVSKLNILTQNIDLGPQNKRQNSSRNKIMPV